MGLKKFVLLLAIISSLFSSCSGEDDQPLSGYEGVITIHARFADGEYDNQIASTNIDVRIGDDLSLIELPNKGIWDGHPGIVKGIFIGKKERRKIKASQLKSFDGTFSDIYVLYYYIGLDGNQKICIDEKKDFDGEYFNCKNNKISLVDGVMTGDYRGVTFVTSPIEKVMDYKYRFDNAVIYDGDKEVHSENLMRQNTSGLEYSFGKVILDENGEQQYVSDLTMVNILSSFYYMCMREYYQESMPMLDFCFSKPNTFSIDYDL